MTFDQVPPCETCADPQDLRAKFNQAADLIQQLNNTNDVVQTATASMAGNIVGEPTDVASAEQSREDSIDIAVRSSQAVEKLNDAFRSITAFACTVNCNVVDAPEGTKCARIGCLSLILSELEEAEVIIAMHDVDKL